MESSGISGYAPCWLAGRSGGPTAEPAGAITPDLVGALAALGTFCAYASTAKTMPRENLATGTVFAIRATPSQKQALKAEAELRGMSQSDLVRQALTDAGVPLWAGVRT